MLQGLEPIARSIPDWRLTTAEILYHLPDHPHVLQTFVWQKLDLAPDFPELTRFLDFWQREIEGPLHSVRVACAALPARRNCATPTGLHPALTRRRRVRAGTEPAR